MSTSNATLTAIVGPMFAGKTEELMRLIKRALIAEKRVLVIKSQVDKRSEHAIVTRGPDRNNPGAFVVVDEYPAHVVNDARTFRKLIAQHNPHIIAIDEAQFFGPWLVTSINKLLEERKGSDFQIITVGLDMDFRRKPFPRVATLLALADEVVKVTALCFVCKKPALFTQKNIVSSQRIEADEGTSSKMYEARCRACHVIPHAT
jgi:thymidine kinase